MSQSYPENPRGIRQRFSRWNTTRRGTKTLKAAYAQAARDVKRMDPAVREQIGRAHVTRADLQMLAGTHVDAQFGPDRYGAVSQQLGQDLSARTSTPAPTRNPLRRIANRYSRWRNTRQGTKMLKAAFTQAARDVKRTDPSVRYAIGRSTINRSDLAALASGRMDEVFRPQGRFQNVPGQQQGQQAQVQQAPQQTAAAAQLNEQMSAQIQSLQATIDQQAQTISVMEENLRLQAQLREMLETRVQQLQAELGQTPQVEGPEVENPRALEENQNETPAVGENTGEPALGENTGEPAVGENTGEPALGENTGEPAVGENTGEPTLGENTGEAAVGENAGGPAVGEDTGEPVVGEDTGEAAVGEDGEAAAVGETGEVAVPGGEVENPAAVTEQGGQSPRSREWFESAAGNREFDSSDLAPNEATSETGAEPVAAETGEGELAAGERETGEGEREAGEIEQPAAEATAETSTGPQQSTVNAEQSGANPQQPGAGAEQTGANPQQTGANPQKPQRVAEQGGQSGGDPKQPAKGGQGERSAGDGLDQAARLQATSQRPLTHVSGKHVTAATRAGGSEDGNRRQTDTQTQRKTPGKEGR
ncbi:hypothetical protein ACXJJ3_30630 [Kribbella sp. WER1]